MAGRRIALRCMRITLALGGLVLAVATLIAWDQDRTKNRRTR